MGKGLNLGQSGTYIAFTAGTGCLVFMDLVAHLIRKNLDVLTDGEKVHAVKKDFKFVFFCSFQNRTEAMGLELMEGLRDICQRLQLTNFELNIRFSNETKQRWNEEFIERQLLIQKNLQRVYVCGPPRMNEEFDKAFGVLSTKHNIPNQTFDVL